MIKISQTPVPKSNCTMPTMYHCSGRGSDREWINIRMRAIPKDKQKDVADEYYRIYLSGTRQSRRMANEYLQNVASEYRALRIKDETKT